jgi:PPOX class probable F420-dependent enzyme
VVLPDSARELLESAALAHMVTLNPDGSPQVTIVWVGLEDGEIVSGHLGRYQKVKNVERDPRVSISLEGEGSNAIGMRYCLVVHGRARVTEGGAPELLQRLAETYVGPGVPFPPMPDPPPGFVIRVTPERIGGLGPWVG